MQTTQFMLWLPNDWKKLAESATNALEHFKNKYPNVNPTHFTINADHKFTSETLAGLKVISNKNTPAKHLALWGTGDFEVRHANES